MNILKCIKHKYKKTKWNFCNYFRKNEHKWNPKKYRLCLTFKILTLFLIYIFILNKLNIISFNFKSWNFLKFNIIEFRPIYKDLVIAQISSTFLTTAILSLVSSIEDKHILGEKTTYLLFGKRLIGFYFPMILLYLFMIINIYLIINESNSNILISLFFLSLIILMYIITKVGSIFVSTKKYIELLYSKYYLECEKSIINNVPPKDYNSPLLINLKEETIKLISNNDNSYVKNINMYKVLIDRILFNIPKDLQKYHLNMSYAPSIVNDFIEVIEHFIYFKDLTRAIQYYNWLLSRFNFHNVFISYDNMNKIFEDIANKIMDFNNEYEVRNYLSKLSPIITNIEMQQHFALTNDYSYTNWPKMRIDYIYHYYSNYFDIVYRNIYNNKYLSEREKLNCYTELHEIFRMSAHNGCTIIRDITNFSYDFTVAKERKMKPYILGQATAFLLLRTLQNKDERSFKLFIGMNLEPEEMRLAIHLTLLALIKMENNNWQYNIYSDYYGIDLDFCKKFINEHLELLFKNQQDWGIKDLINYVQEDYNYILKNCFEDDKEDSLFLNFIFKYDKDLINQYFKIITDKFKVKIVIKNSKEKDYKKIINNYLK